MCHVGQLHGVFRTCYCSKVPDSLPQSRNTSEKPYVLRKGVLIRCVRHFRTPTAINPTHVSCLKRCTTDKRRPYARCRREEKRTTECGWWGWLLGSMSLGSTTLGSATTGAQIAPTSYPLALFEAATESFKLYQTVSTGGTKRQRRRMTRNICRHEQEARCYPDGPEKLPVYVPPWAAIAHRPQKVALHPRQARQCPH